MGVGRPGSPDSADLPVGLGCRVQSVASLGWGGFWVRAAARGAAGALGASCPEAELASSGQHAVGMSTGLGSVLLALAEGGVSWRRGSQCLRGSLVGGISPQELQMEPVSSSIQRSGKEGRGWGARNCWQGLFSKPLGGQATPVPTPSTALLGKGAG